MSLMQVNSPCPFPPRLTREHHRRRWARRAELDWSARPQQAAEPRKGTQVPLPSPRCAAPSLTELPVAISQQCATEKQSWSASIAKRTANRGVRSPRSQSKVMLSQCPSCTGRLVLPPWPQLHRLWSPRRHLQVQHPYSLNPTS